MFTNDRIVSMVDDEADITDLFGDALCRIKGLSIITFNDPVKALEHFTKNKKEYVLVLSDYRMPSINGLDLLRKVKSQNPRVRTVSMTAFDLGGDDLPKENLTEEIINTFIQKPTIFALCNEVNNQIHTYELLSTGGKDQ